MFYFVGLGNPGTEYENTRHNVGAMALEYVHEHNAFTHWYTDGKLNALVSEGSVCCQEAMFVLPQTYMNKSGASVKKIITNAKKADQLVVVYDDIDLPFGHVKISYGRGTGGHNGLESIVSALGTKKFTRIRIGITPVEPDGTPKKPRGEKAVVDFVLGKFKSYEEEKLEEIYKQVHQAMQLLVHEGRERAMNEIN